MCALRNNTQNEQRNINAWVNKASVLYASKSINCQTDEIGLQVTAIMCASWPNNTSNRLMKSCQFEFTHGWFSFAISDQYTRLIYFALALELQLVSCVNLRVTCIHYKENAAQNSVNHKRRQSSNHNMMFYVICFTITCTSKRIIAVEKFLTTITYRRYVENSIIMRSLASISNLRYNRPQTRTHRKLWNWIYK